MCLNMFKEVSVTLLWFFLLPDLMNFFQAYKIFSRTNQLIIKLIII